MLEKMIKLYQNPKRRDNFAQNEQVYDLFLASLFNKFDTNSKNEQFYDNIFTNLAGQCTANSKAASALKHQCYDLTYWLQKTSEAINKIALTLNECMAEENALYAKLNFKTDETVNITRKRFVTGLQEWGSEVLSVKKFVNDNLASFFHFQKHENIELSILMNYKLQITNQYKKKAFDLEKQKAKLFEVKDPVKWKLEISNVQEDIMDMMNSYPKIRQHMLPEV